MSSPSALSPNTLVHERYLIVRPIGQGGMGAVYEAIDQRLGNTIALKHGTIAGDVLEIEGTPQEQARALVAGMPGVREVAPYGARLHATVDDAARRGPQLSAALQAAGVADARVERIDPSLEDVFVALLGGSATGDS